MTEEPGGYGPWGHKDLDTTERQTQIQKGKVQVSIKENGTPSIEHTHTDISFTVASSSSQTFAECLPKGSRIGKRPADVCLERQFVSFL